MSIRSKLIFIFLGAASAIALTGALAVWTYSRSLVQIQQAAMNTGSVLANTYRAELQFEQQKLAWSHLVLRGQDAEQYYRHLADFYRHERGTRAALSKVLEQVEQDSGKHKRIVHFQEVHQLLGERYREALRMYNASEDPTFTADRYIWNAVDNPTAELRSVVDQILQSQQETLQSVQAAFHASENRIATVSILLIVGFTALFYWFLHRTVTRPLVQISSVAREIAEGNTEQRLHPLSDDEFGSVANGLNRMLDSLDTASQSLNLKVSELKREVERRDKAERALEARQSELENINSELQSFSYSIAHDLRAPLRAVTGFSQVLSDELHETLTPEQNDMLDRIAAAGIRMGGLIDHIMEFSRLGRGELMLKTIDLTDLAHQISMDLQASEPTRQVELEIQDNLSATADPRMARVILENLLGNAWKYTALEPHAKISFGIWKSNGRTVYQVRDNGVGFDMTYSDRLFGIFQRLHHEDVFPGDGVGLASVQRAVNRHGGQVWAKSDPGQGATFFFSLGDSRE